MSKGEAREAYNPPDFCRSEGAAGSGSAPHYFTPPQIFRLWHMPAQYLSFLLECLLTSWPKNGTATYFENRLFPKIDGRYDLEVEIAKKTKQTSSAVRRSTTKHFENS